MINKNKLKFSECSYLLLYSYYEYAQWNKNKQAAFYATTRNSDAFILAGGAGL